MRTKKHNYSSDIYSDWFELTYNEDDRDDVLSFISQIAAENYVKNLADIWNPNIGFPIVYWEIIESDN